AGTLIVHAAALINLDHRLNAWIIVAPVGAHAGGTSVRGADAVELLEILVEHLRIGGVNDVVTIGFGQARQRADAAAGENDVAVAFGIGDAPLIGIGRIEKAGNAESVGRFL